MYNYIVNKFNVQQKKEIWSENILIRKQGWYQQHVISTLY